MPSRINGPLAHYLTEELPLAIENHGRSAGFSDWSVAAADRIRRCPDRMCHSRVCPRCTRIEARGRANEYRSKISGHSIPWGHSWGHFVLAPAWTGAENVDHDAYREAVQKIGSAVRYLRRNFWTEPRIAGVCRVEISPAGFAHGHLLVCAPEDRGGLDAVQAGVRKWSKGRMRLEVDQYPVSADGILAVTDYVFKGPVPTLRGTWLDPNIAARFLCGTRNMHLGRPFGRFQRIST
jgi:hypothetical protein